MSDATPVVLLVDDSAAIRSILKVYLAPLGVQTVDSDRGDRALQALRLMPVSLVIADVNMPGMDGVSFVKAVRSLAEADLRQTPIVLLTASSDANLRDTALKAGADVFLQKPVDSAHFVAIVRRFLHPGSPPPPT
ncbi:MAG: response regulator [Deltaproteobacteria bacterium]|nr:response regulator [Deltaproteobacteria bacterium]